MRNLYGMAAITAALVACDAAPHSGVTAQRSEIEDLVGILNVQDLGPSEAKVGIVEVGGYPDLISHLSSERQSALGFPDATIEVTDTNGGQSYPAFDRQGAIDAAKMLDGISLTAGNAPIVVVQASARTGAAIGAAIDQLVAQGVKTIAGVEQIPGTEMATLLPHLQAARAANVQLVWSPGLNPTGAGFQATDPMPVSALDSNGHLMLFSVGVTDAQSATNTRGWIESINAGSVASTNRPADVTIPAKGLVFLPDTSNTAQGFVAVSHDPAYAVGLAAGVLTRDLTLHAPADLTSGLASRFFDVAAGSIGTCSTCSATAGKDLPSGWGTPDVATFGSF